MSLYKLTHAILTLSGPHRHILFLISAKLNRCIKYKGYQTQFARYNVEIRQLVYNGTGFV